ncbi:MAG TPA: universal stress protein [Myxococcales bacterium]|nr:universal stress protein [Myxococcales bacterium]
MKRILVGVDGSAEAVAAVDKAIEIASAMGANVLLAYIVPHHVPPGPEAYAPELVRADKLEHGYAAAVLRDLEMRCTSRSVAVDSTTRTGPVAETLADMAEAGGFDLVVVGHRGRGGVRRALLGSVADRLVQISSRPVLVVR